jgi:hypothetical protein
MLLAHGTGSNWLGVAHLTFADSIPVMVSSPNDADNDGMLDVWELAHGFSTNDDTDASADANTNGVSNLDEFLNGTDPCEPREVFAFPPLHRYPYSNGFYCAPDVPLEWFASSTLGRYQVEVAVWPACDTLVYRAEVWDTNAIGDAVVHTADLTAGAGTQCAFRVRAAFTNETGWTAWNGWRPFSVLEPLSDHTLRIANGEPLRGMYFMFWDESGIISNWFYTNSYGVVCINPTNWLAATNTYWWPFDWKNNDMPCVSDLFLISQLNYNTLMLDQQSFYFLGEPSGFVTNNAIPGSTLYRGFNVSSNFIIPLNEPGYWLVATNLIYWNTNYWWPQFDRDNCLTHTAGLYELPWLSYGSAFGGVGIHPNRHYYEELNTYLGLRYVGQPLNLSNALYQVKIRFAPGVYSVARHSGPDPTFFPDLHHPLLRDTWVGIINDYLYRYAGDTNTSDNALVHVQHRGKVVPVVAPVLELMFGQVRDFADATLNAFRGWLAQRYGATKYLNSAWQTNCFSEWQEIDPIAQESTIFRWEWRNGTDTACSEIPGWSSYHYVRACDDFDEFSIERYCAAWRAVKDLVRKNRDVLFALEVWDQSFYNQDAHGVPQTVAPLHRIADWADVLVKREGYTAYTAKQQQALAEVQKAGKYCIFTINSDVTWQPANAECPYSLKYLAEQGLENYPNTAVLAYNELVWRPADGYLASFIYALDQRTNDYPRFAQWVEARNTPRIPNCSAEQGVASYIPEWTWQPHDRLVLSSTRSLKGRNSLCIRGGSGAVQLTSGAYALNHTNLYVLLYAKLESATPNMNVTLDVGLNHTQHNLLTYENGVWCNPQSEANSQNLQAWLESASIAAGDDTMRYLPEQWISLLTRFTGFAPGTPVNIRLSATVPDGATLYLDYINIVDVP